MLNPSNLQAKSNSINPTTSIKDRIQQNNPKVRSQSVSTFQPKGGPSSQENQDKYKWRLKMLRSLLTEGSITMEQFVEYDRRNRINFGIPLEEPAAGGRPTSGPPAPKEREGNVTGGVTEEKGLMSGSGGSGSEKRTMDLEGNIGNGGGEGGVSGVAESGVAAKAMIANLQINLKKHTTPEKLNLNNKPDNQTQIPKNFGTEGSKNPDKKATKTLSPKEGDTWWFLQGNNQNLEMFDKALARNPDDNFALAHVIVTKEGNIFFIWRLSNHKTEKEWGSWFLSAYREAIGAPPPTKSDISSGEDEGEGEGEGDGQGADTNSEGDGESDKEGERDGEDGEDKDNTESKEKEQDSSKSGSGSSKSGSSKSDSEEEEEEGDEVQIISPSIPASWGKPDTHVGGLWYVGFKVQDLDKWLSSQSKAPSDYNCIFYSHNVNKEDEEDALLVHTVWRIQGEPEEGTFKEYSEGLVDDENNFLMLEMIENDCRGFT